MFDRVKEAAQAASDKVRDAASQAGDAVGDAAETSAQASISRALDVMELAALASLNRPTIRDVTISAEVNLLVGRVSISASFDPEQLQQRLQDPEVQKMLAEPDEHPKISGGSS